MGKIKLVNFKRRRYISNRSMMLKSCKIILDEKKDNLAGYLIMAWDDSGGTSVQSKSGGPVNHDLLPLHAFSMLTSMVK